LCIKYENYRALPATELHQKIALTVEAMADNNVAIPQYSHILQIAINANAVTVTMTGMSLRFINTL